MTERRFDVYDMDRHVNTFERQVRQKVLKHLSITGATNVGPGLVLASIVVDIERIGDHTKNIMDLAKSHPTRLACGKYEADIAGIETGVK